MPGFTAVVIGASGGIGHALADALAPTAGKVHRLSRSDGTIDLLDEASIAAAAAQIGPVDLLINAAGLLHAPDLAPEKTWAALNAEAMERVFAVNTIGPALLAKHFLPLLPRGRKAVFAALSARVGSISDNRIGGWASYRASKAALNQIIRTLSIELARRRPEAVIAGLHPGTVNTSLSKPFQGTRALFTPEESAAHLLSVLDRLGPADSGGHFAWDGKRVPD